MGAASSKVQEDKALQLCGERKKFVRQALDGRCSLAAAHVAYVQSLRKTGSALRKFVQPEDPMESSLYTSTNATPEPPPLTEKSVSHFSLSPAPSLSRPAEFSDTLSPSPSPPPTSFRINHMKSQGSYSTKVEERPPVVVTVTSSNVPRTSTPHSMEKLETSSFEGSGAPSGTPQWDYFGLSHPIDRQFSSRDGTRVKQESENLEHLGEYREDEDRRASFSGSDSSRDSEDEFDEPSTHTLVRRFENLNRVNSQGNASPSATMWSARSVASETELLRDEANSPHLSPLQHNSSAATIGSNSKRTPVKEERAGSKVAAPKEFGVSIKDIEFLFVKASESGGEVPRMLEANKVHFRPIFPKGESGPLAFAYFKSCFSCGRNHRHVQEEPAQATMKYLTWHRTASSRSASSRNLHGMNPKAESEDHSASLFDNFCMTSGSHASTLDRLYAWERKLYDEVKASELVRRRYDIKCKHLRQLESKKERSDQIDRTRAVVKDLFSRIKVAIHRIDSISKRIEELRDRELQPQLEELIEGLSRMWEVMFECHKRQHQIILAALNVTDLSAHTRSESFRQITINLETELNSLSLSFVKWVNAQKSYLRAIDNWLHKCVIPRNTRRRRRGPAPQIRNFGPPIYVTCGVWLESLDSLQTKPVTDAIKALTIETSRFLPRQEKNRGRSHSRSAFAPGKADDGTESSVSMLRYDASEDWGSRFDRFRSALAGFLAQLSDYSESTVKKYAELDKDIKNAKTIYEQFLSHMRKAQERSRKAED